MLKNKQKLPQKFLTLPIFKTFMSDIFIENIFRNNSSGMIKILNKKPSIKLHIFKILIDSVENNNCRLQTEKKSWFCEIFERKQTNRCRNRKEKQFYVERKSEI
jgi:hypothetical protein